MEQYGVFGLFGCWMLSFLVGGFFGQQMFQFLDFCMVVDLVGQCFGEWVLLRGGFVDYWVWFLYYQGVVINDV